MGTAPALGGHRRARTGPAPLRWLVTFVVLALLVAGWLVWLLSNDDRADSSRVRSAAAVVAARNAAVAFFSLDEAHVHEQTDRMLAMTTGEFRHEYAGSLDQVIARVERNHLVETAAVPTDGAGLETYDGRQAGVLVAVEVMSRSGTASPATDHRRARISLVRTGETWRVSAIALLDAATTPGTVAVSGLTQADAAPVQVAVTAAGKALGYDYRTLDQDLAGAVALMTPAFADQFRDTFATAVRPLALQRKVIAAAYVRGAALVRRQGDHARVLVFADQVLSPGPGARPSAVRVLIDLDRVGGGWQVSGITPI